MVVVSRRPATAPGALGIVNRNSTHMRRTPLVRHEQSRDLGADRCPPPPGRPAAAAKPPKRGESIMMSIR